MKKKYFSSIALALGIMVCLFATYMNYKYNEKLQIRDLQEKAKWLKGQDIVSSHDISDLKIFSSHGDTMSLSSLAKYGVRIGIYAHRSQCSDCWKVIARNIQNICNMYHVTEPFILADGFRPIDLRIMAKDDNIIVPFFGLLENDDSYIAKMSRVGKPFVFLLNQDSSISSVMFYNDAIVPILEEYLKSLSVDSLNKGCLVVDKPNIKLGTVPIRREFSLHYSIKNSSNKICKIKEVTPSCSCVEIKDYPSQINPGKTSDIDVVFTSDLFGPFMREIEVYTDFQDEPYVLTIEGNCQ